MQLGQPLLRICRGEIVEVELKAIVGITHRDGSIFANQLQDTCIWARSLLKPFQYLALAETGKNELEIPEELIAIASSSGEALHERALDSLANHWHINIEERLYCKPSLPMSEKLAWQKRLNQDPSLRRFHPCAGKHLNFFKHSGDGYQHSDSLAHQKIVNLLKDWGLNGSVTIMPDSCGVQTFALRIETQLHLWRKLVSNHHDHKLVQSLVDHWSANPVLVGGSDRLDSQITMWTKGRVLAKEGADGLLVLAHRDSHEIIFIKCTSRYQQLHLRLLLLATLERHHKTLAEEFAAIHMQLKNSSLVSPDQNLQILI